MAKLFIQDTTLTAIADAIRAKSGGGAEPQSFIAVHSPNTFGFGENDYDSSIPVWDSATGSVYEGSGFTTYSNTYEVQIPGATKLVVKISSFHNYSISASKKIEIRKNWYSENNGSLEKTIYAVSEQTYEIASDKMSFYIQFTDNNTYTGYGFYAEITGYDADGNLIMIGGASAASDVTYTPLEMPAAILAISGEGGGGITPTGEIEILENGDFDVTQYASAHVEVPVGVFPSGDLAISANGVYDIEKYQTVTVLVASSGGSDVEPMVLTGDMSNACSNVFATFVIENFGDKVTTENLNSTSNMFYGSTLKLIPFALNYEWTTSRYYSAQQMFMECYYLEKAPQMVYFRPGYCYQMFEKCQNLRDVSGIENWDCSYLNNGYSPMRRLFANCQSLRSVPEAFLNKFYNWDSSSYNVHTYGMFYNCNHIDEIVGLGFHPDGHWNSNNFQDAFTYCYCLKRLTFKTYEDGTPIPVDWTNQTIDLSDSIGYHCNLSNTDWNYVEKRLFNSGRTLDKNIYNDETYAALKNDPNAFVIGNSWEGSNWYYSRYDKASALETIASLPDTSPYGGSNTIKFKGEAGLKTDAGAINTMTEAEIAVAAAKGWTVTFV